MILEFEGVYHEAEVWINDIKAAFRPYGYTNFYVDATELFHIGKHNHISVILQKCRSAKQPLVFGAGIYRPVTLWVGMIYTFR